MATATFRLVYDSPTSLGGNLYITWSEAVTGFTDADITPSKRLLAGDEVRHQGNNVYAYRFFILDRTGLYFTIAADAVDEGNPQYIYPPQLPDAPTSLTATVTGKTIELSWTAPASTGGSAILRYEYRYAEGATAGGTWTTTGGTGTTFTVTGLDPNTQYTFEVRAVTDQGDGPASGAVSATTEIVAPDAPRTLTGTAAATSVALGWLAPASNGGSAITRYEYRVREGSKAWGSWTSTGGTTRAGTVTGLKKGQAYSFQVRAINTISTGVEGESAASNTLTLTTDTTVPGAPTGLTATADGKTVDLSWAAPVDIGGTALTRYEYRYAQGTSAGGTWRSTGGTGTTFTVTGLDPNTQYTFEVRAVNAEGNGSASGTATERTEIVAPDAPRTLTGTAAATSVALGWLAPVSNGGSAIIRYEYRYREGSKAWGSWTTTGGTGRSFTVTGLKKGTAYSFQVRAVNNITAQTEGISAASSTLTLTTDTTVPGIPTDLTVTPDGLGFDVSWKAPVDDGGTPITKYEYRYRRGGSAGGTWTSVGTQTSVSVSGLRGNTRYTFQVRAVNAEGNSAPTAGVTERTEDVVPDAPTGLAAALTSTTAVLTWAAPESNGGSAILRYEYRYIAGKSAGGTWTTTGGTDPTFTITGLDRNTEYTFQVHAVNAKGASVSSNTVTQTTPQTNVSAPRTFRVVPTTTTAVLTWTAPAQTEGATISRYEYRYVKGDEISGDWVSAGTALTATVTGLEKGTEYAFQVRAVIAAGAGIPSGVVTATTDSDVPDAPTALVVTPAKTTAVLAWDAPANDGGTPLTGYDYRYRETGGSWGDWKPVGSRVATSVTEIPTTLAIVSGNTQSAEISTALAAPFVIQVNDQNGDPLAGVTVAFATNIGTLSVASATTDANGRASVTLTTPAETGTIIVTASVAGLIPVVFIATSTAPSGQRQFTITPDDATLAPGGTTTVTISANGTGRVGGVFGALSFSAGSTSGFSRISDRSWRVTLTAPSTGSGVIKVGVSRNGTSPGANAAAYAFIRYGSATPVATHLYRISGSGHAAQVGTALTQPFVVEVRDQNGDPLSGVTVAFTTTGGTLSSASETTDSNGRASVTLTMPATTGSVTVTAASSGLTSVQFSATATVATVLQRTVTVTGLVGNTSYEFEVRAVNAEGNSVASAAVTAKTTPVVPVAPGPLSVATTPTTAVLTWAAPSDTGGAPVLRYEYRQGTSGAWTSAGTALTATVTGLDKGTQYTFQVRAINRIGASPHRQRTATTDTTRPTLPRSFAATPGPNSVQLRWAAPADIGGTPITKYEYRRGTTGSWTSAGTALAATITGLAKGTAYTFQVRAVNAKGESLIATVNTQTTTTVSTVPRSLQLTAAETRISATWTAPADTGGTPITRYEYRYRRGSGSWSAWTSTGTVLTATLTGLVKGTGYTVAVRAVNAVGNSPVASQTATTLTTVPTAPRTFTARATGTSIALSWAAPVDNGGTAILRYEYRYQETVRGTWRNWASVGRSLTRTISRLQPETRYTFEVRAVNAKGNSPAVSTTALTNQRVPDAPTGVTVVARSGTTALLTWKSPGDVTGFQVNWAAGSSIGSNWRRGRGTQTSYLVTGLNRQTQYAFAVRSVNGAITGARSQIKTLRTPIASPHNALFFKQCVNYLGNGARVKKRGTSQIIRAVADNDYETFSQEKDYTVDVSRNGSATRVHAFFVKCRGVTRHSGTPSGGSGSGWSNVTLPGNVRNAEGASVATRVGDFQHHLLLLNSSFTAKTVRLQFQGSSVRIYEVMLLEFGIEIDANGDFTDILADLVDRRGTLDENGDGELDYGPPIGNARDKWEIEYVMEVVPGRTLIQTPEDFLYWRAANRNAVHAVEPSRFPSLIFPATFTGERVPVRYRTDDKTAGEIVSFQVAER